MEASMYRLPDLLSLVHAGRYFRVVDLLVHSYDMQVSGFGASERDAHMSHPALQQVFTS